MITVIYGPRGSGKTRHADAFKAHFRAKNVYDAPESDFDRIKDGDLVLTNEEPFAFSERLPSRLRNRRLNYVAIADALRAIGKGTGA